MLIVVVLALVGVSPLQASQAGDKREEVFQAAVGSTEAGHLQVAAVPLDGCSRNAGEFLMFTNCWTCLWGAVGSVKATSI